MKSLAVLLVVALSVIAVNARHYTDRSEDEQHDDLSDTAEPNRDHRGGQMRHRRKRWQMNYGYNYPQQYNPYYGPYGTSNDELIPQIWRLLDEISGYVRRPPPPPVAPQIIYLPYPVPQNCTCNVRLVPNITSRFPVLEDENQNWGIAGDTNGKDYEDDGSDGSRPITFDPIKPKTQMKKQQPEVERESEQPTNINEKRTPPPPARVDATCNAAILNCCRERSQQQRKACFTRVSCGMTFSRNGCSAESVAAAMEYFRLSYAPS